MLPEALGEKAGPERGAEPGDEKEGAACVRGRGQWVGRRPEGGEGSDWVPSSGPAWVRVTHSPPWHH